MKKVKKKHRIRSFLVIILFFYLVGASGYYLLRLPIKNIYVIGTNYLTDLEIIETAGLKDYPALIKVKNNKIEKKLRKLDLVENVKVKKNIFGKVTIEVDEAKPLFYSRSNDLIYLSNNKTTENKDIYLGIPILINYVPKEILSDFIKKFKNIDTSIIKMVSEIEYSLEEKDGVTIDETRFILRMNDTNTVYVNTINLKRLNEYEKICATMDENVKGIIYLNSNRDTISITSYESLKEQEAKKQEEEVAENED